MAADCLHTTYQPALKVHKPWSAWTVCNGKDTTCVCVCVCILQAFYCRSDQVSLVSFSLDGRGVTGRNSFREWRKRGVNQVGGLTVMKNTQWTHAHTHQNTHTVLHTHTQIRERGFQCETSLKKNKQSFLLLVSSHTHTHTLIRSDQMLLTHTHTHTVHEDPTHQRTCCCSPCLLLRLGTLLLCYRPLWCPAAGVCVSMDSSSISLSMSHTLLRGVHQCVCVRERTCV